LSWTAWPLAIVNHPIVTESSTALSSTRTMSLLETRANVSDAHQAPMLGSALIVRCSTIDTSSIRRDRCTGVAVCCRVWLQPLFVLLQRLHERHDLLLGRDTTDTLLLP